MIRFLLNDELIDFDTHQEATHDASFGAPHDSPVDAALYGCSADLTVLDWLRIRQQLTGTKEGCGSGDCGACTVVLVTASDTPSGLPLNYTPANACILMMGALHGRQLITVEHLGSSVNLHLVQSAMVEHHGSQCGFCTPGFVMSLFTLFHQNFEADELLNDAEQRHALIEQYLGGNLCRCTGYRPIIAAAELVLQARFRQNVTDQFDTVAADTAIALRSLVGRGASSAQTIHVPTEIAQALSLWSKIPSAHIVAGGTDKGLEITQQLSSWSSVIHLSDITELRQIEHNVESLVVGAGVSIAELIDTLSLDYPDAVPMLLRFGSEQVRSQATVGGNLGTGSPIGDLPPLLLALGASINLVSLNADGQTLSTRTEPLADYFTGYRQTLLAKNEWIQSVSIPSPTEADVLRVYKISKRMDDDISSVCAAIWMQVDSVEAPQTITNVRLGFGGMAATPKRAVHAEEALLGGKLCDESIEAACSALSQDFQPIDDARASARYRQRVAANLLRRFIVELNQPDEPTSINALAAFAEGVES